MWLLVLCDMNFSKFFKLKSPCYGFYYLSKFYNEYDNIHYFSIGIIEYVIHFHAVKIHYRLAL